MTTRPRYRAPAECPVCGGELVTTRLGCHSCGTELAGDFGRCGFCDLDEAESELLRVFPASRGSLREGEKHLGVYRKARLGNTFRWELTEMGYSKPFVEKATEGLIVYIPHKNAAATAADSK